MDGQTYVADGVLLNVDAKLVDALGSGLSRNSKVGIVDDLVRSCLHEDLVAEVEDLLILLPVVVLPLVVPVLVAVLVVLGGYLVGLFDDGAIVGRRDS